MSKCTCTNPILCPRLACKVRARLDIIGIGQTECDRRIGKQLGEGQKAPRDYTGRILYGKNKNPRKYLQQLAEVLGVTPSFLTEHKIPNARFDNVRSLIPGVNLPAWRGPIKYDSETSDRDGGFNTKPCGRLLDVRKPPLQPNRFAIAATKFRNEHSNSKKLTIFQTQIIDGEWVADTTDAIMQRNPIVKTFQNDRIYGFSYPEGGDYPCLPAGATIFATHESRTLKNGDMFIAIQDADMPIADMFGIPIASNPDAPANQRKTAHAGTVYRLSLWRYLGRAKNARDCLLALRLGGTGQDEEALVRTRIALAYVVAIVM